MKMLMNGQWVDATDGRVIEIHNPATGELLDTVPRAGAADVDLAVGYARRGYEINRALTSRIRSAYLHRIADLMDQHHEELQQLMVAENGKSQSWADFEIGKATEIFRIQPVGNLCFGFFDFYFQKELSEKRRELTKADVLNCGFWVTKNTVLGHPP